MVSCMPPPIDCKGGCLHCESIHVETRTRKFMFRVSSFCMLVPKLLMTPHLGQRNIRSVVITQFED